MNDDEDGGEQCMSPEQEGERTDIWKLVVSTAGVIGLFILLFNPHLRDMWAWLMFGGMAGVVPVDALARRVSGS